ncbi:NADH dehydrogenase (ubiquinone) Fe-S protein 5 [Cryptococcus deuterogattii 99/473]|uniref:Unplaced genomic scaffold supercont1.6, whole genome shotgun sequence n=1 Tax=Cryptococcus deuterogattii Ram5 TaxID=1296110 RepID=A0A0D0T5H2_9TREE|nr:NADH dehydrogenase (ubiquinone) Fe-S protein 5 [Cryptococcus deuterogattii LA55]KIR31383.1 NADH dehydrogenase (ubiquinone) Fe-S protein 5 [Cryptococcus deuterogattii MMRL2647]KIR41152.1 NADH dehydrogenase (ubiquinone) Fe-S protein 5 [Cryptococcus deuterogattii Ram5]KIR72507.1 NADH dehydrogenase (ubiquinone) Fe-S protein 5 [Cryptococcus deuterogattii CA1014]KIR92102.1 NADH dehydrogenase (ubiquinone) Fe-S protein 5 [Cryptococcus deuterogattii CBS 10090]KIR96082.1 NADH dehydrogenase (ubiquinon
MLGPVITALTRQFPILDPLPFTKFTLKNFANPTQCYANAEKPSDCVAPKDDYMECLHNTKEIARAKEVKSHFVQKELQESHDSRKAAEKAATGVIVSLGLVEEEGK